MQSKLKFNLKNRKLNEFLSKPRVAFSDKDFFRHLKNQNFILNDQGYSNHLIRQSNLV
jgi:hypothetical protein